MEGKILEKTDRELHKKVRAANELYHNQVAEVYEKDESLAGSHNAFNQARIERIVKKLSEKTGGALFLDLACGTGNVLKFGAKYFKNAVGVDISFNMLKMAKSRGLKVAQADAVNLPFEDEKFDGVSCFSVVHHLSNHFLFFREIHRVLKEGGILYTDWDPLYRPQPDEKNLNWKFYSFGKKLFKLGENFGKKLFSSNNKEKKGESCFKNENPEVQNIYKLAEYHLPSSGGEGINFDSIKELLLEIGFKEVSLTFHWNGKKFSQLPLKQKINIKAMQFFGLLPKDFAENLLIIAKK